MSKIGLIIKREYLRRVSKKSFLLITLLSPLLFAALVFLPLWLSSIKGGGEKRVIIVDTTERYAPLFENTDEYVFETQKYGSLSELKDNNDTEIFAFLSITNDLLEHPEAATLYSEKQIPMSLKSIINNTLQNEIRNEKLATYDIENLSQIIKESSLDFDIKTFKLDKDGEEKNTSSEFAAVFGMILTFVIYMFVLLYGGMVMQGVMEEKTNRIVEVMVSSVKPFDLMMGKIIGIGLVGLTQMFIWGILIAAILSGSMMLFGSASSTMDIVAMGSNMPQMPMDNDVAVIIQQVLNTINFSEIGTCFVLYFIGGYLLYASLFAAIGSALDQPEDSQQFMVPITMLMVFSLYAGIYSMENPDGPLAMWCSMIPLTSPIVMMVRLPFDIPLWQLIISLLLLFATAIFIVWISARIYRVGILMYGKKPSMKEMIKWLKYN